MTLIAVGKIRCWPDGKTAEACFYDTKKKKFVRIVAPVQW